MTLRVNFLSLFPDFITTDLNLYKLQTVYELTCLITVFFVSILHELKSCVVLCL